MVPYSDIDRAERQFTQEALDGILATGSGPVMPVGYYPSSSTGDKALQHVTEEQLEVMRHPMMPIAVLPSSSNGGDKALYWSAEEQVLGTDTITGVALP